MFKHEINPTQSYVISKKERKDICKKLKVKYNPDAIEYISENFPTLTMSKISLNGNKLKLISNEQCPLFFEIRNDEYLPTMYSMHMFGEMIKYKAIIYEETDSFLENGADLMLKGILNRDEIKQIQFKLGDTFIVQTDSGMITSIGSAMMAANTINFDLPSGKFLKIIHRTGDTLWNIGNKKILPMVNFKKSPIINEVNEGAENSTLITSNVEIKGEDVPIENPNVEITSTMKEEGHISHEQPEIKLDELEISDKEEQVTQEEMDLRILHVFLNLLKLAFKDDMLPMDPGKLLKEYIYPLGEEMGIEIDFKHSSFKKINNFLKTMHKEKDLIGFGKPKGMQNDFFLSINWNNDMLKNFLPKIKKLKFLTQKTTNDDKDNVILSKDEKIDVECLYKPNERIKHIFKQIDPEFDSANYYPLKYCNEILTKYIKLKELFSKDGSAILNEELTKIFNKVSANYGLIVLKMDEILQIWKKNLNEKSFIIKTGAEGSEVLSKSKPLTVKIIAKKITNKNVTIIDGLENFVNIKDVIKTFAKHFACSVTTKDVSGLKDAICIQGYWVNELLTILQEEIKLDKKFIKVEDKLKLKKK